MKFLKKLFGKNRDTRTNSPEARKRILLSEYKRLKAARDAQRRKATAPQPELVWPDDFRGVVYCPRNAPPKQRAAFERYCKDADAAYKRYLARKGWL